MMTPVEELLPESAFIGHFSAQTETADWAVVWLPEGGELITESWVIFLRTILALLRMRFCAWAMNISAKASPTINYAMERFAS